MTVLCWLPSHIGIAGSKKAVKRAPGLDSDGTAILHTDLQPLGEELIKYVFLYSVKPILEQRSDKGKEHT